MRRTLVAGLVLGTALAALPVAGAGAGEPPEPRPSPEAGTELPAATDNVSAALAWSSLFDAAPTVLLARDDDFADSLASGGLQGLLDAPLLLTGTDALDERVEAELLRLGAQTVVILGGTNAVSQDVEDALTDAGYEVQRKAGTTRIETATQLAVDHFADATTAVLARAYQSFSSDDPTQAWADSLAAGGMAARRGVPVLLTGEELSASTLEHLDASTVETVIVVGGEEAVSADVVTALEDAGYEVVRLAGADRFATAAVIGSADFPEGSEVVLLLEGQHEDAWAGGFSAASAAESAPILLATGEEVPDATLDTLGFGIPPVCGPRLDPVACERGEIASTAAQFPGPGALTAILEGVNEVPDPAAPETGTGDILATAADDALCYVVSYQGDPLVAAHIHRGVEGENGDVVVPLHVPLEGTDTVFSCAFDLDPELVAEILADPAAFYVNVHTEEFPDGAGRDQLFVPEVVGVADLLPDAEVPPTDAAGEGFIFALTHADDHTQLCYQYGYFLDEPVVAAHFHEGPEDAAGPVVHPMELPDPEALAILTTCDDADPALVEAIIAAPGDYYVNLHTATYPDGAIRGQLFNPFAAPAAQPRAGWARG